MIPRRRPTFAAALLVTLALLLLALGVRYVTLGFSNGQGLTSTLFPAFVVIALYAGWRWGVAAVTTMTVFVWWVMGRATGGVLGAEQWEGLVIYVISALVTVAVAGALRETVVRLDAARHDRDESEGRFRVLADSAAAMMWVTRADRSREFVNAAYVEFLGRTYDDALRFDWRDRLHKDDIDRVMTEQVEGEASLQPFVLEGRYLRSDGKWRWLRSFSRPRLAANGALEGFIGMAFDITDAKQVEADLKGINELLADKVSEAMSERDQAQAALMQAQKLEAVGQLTGGVAHDFNNLLTVVIGALDIILRHPDDAARRQRLGEAALAAARRGERLTQQLLAFSRRQPLRPELMSIDALLNEAEPLLRRAVGESYDLRFELDAGPAAARIDGGQFEAAVLNLLLNARDAVAEGGHIVVRTGIVHQGRQAGAPAHFSITVEDDGEGMDHATQARVFEPFFTTKPVGRGTGLGLSQVYGFARQSGGDVEIDSALGQGARIRMLLPVAAAAPEALRPAVLRAPGRRGLKVLLVEDDADVGDLVEAMLGELSHHVLRAGDVEQALRVAADEPAIDLVLTDVIMPGGRNGVELAHALTRVRPTLPVILSSGYTAESLVDAENAPWALLRKPYTLEQLDEAVTEAVCGAPCQASAAPAA